MIHIKHKLIHNINWKWIPTKEIRPEYLCLLDECQETAVSGSSWYLGNFHFSNKNLGVFGGIKFGGIKNWGVFMGYIAISPCIGRGSGWESHCVKQYKRLQIQTFSNQRSNALDSVNLAPAVNGLGCPHADLSRRIRQSFSMESQKRES